MITVEMLDKYLQESKGNYVSKEDALRPELVGMKIFDTPLMCVGDVEDPKFRELQELQAIGPHFRLPQEWLPGAKSVVSMFFPFTDFVKSSNTPANAEPSDEWLHARIEGQKFLNEVCLFIKEELERQGEQAVVPILTENFWAVEKPGTNPRAAGPELGFTSNWSERHAAFVCGLGTFCLSKGLITEKGVCGRFASVITTAELPATTRPYKEVYEYCNMCGACIRHCPVGAISLEGGKDHELCRQYVDEMKIRYAPRYGCGKCQIAVPCMSRIPNKIK